MNGSLGSLVRAELLKVRTARSYLLLAATVVLTAGLPLLAFIAPGTSIESVEVSGTLPGVRLGGVELSALLVMLLAALGTAGEYHHRTAVSTFLVAPRRREVVGAKLVAYAAAGGLLTLLAAVVSIAVFPPAAAAAGVEFSAPASAVLEAVAVSALLGAVFGAFGVGVGALVRNQTAAAMGCLIWFLVLENIVALVGGSLEEWLPGTATAAVAGAAEELSRGAGVGVLLAWVAAVTVAAVVVTASRDVA